MEGPVGESEMDLSVVIPCYNQAPHLRAGDYDYRYDLEGFRTLAEKYGATAFHHRPEQRNAMAVFEKGCTRWTGEPAG